VNFSSFNLENNYDFLTIYNGPNAASPILGNYTGTNSPGIVQASVSNVSGCLTFVFTSDVSFVSSGWLASFNCLAPCQTITSNLVSTNPAPNINGVIQICPGTPVSFQGSGTFSQTGSGANYLWNYGNGVSSAGANGSYTYNTPGTYFVNLGISLNGCSNTNSINQMVQVSTQTVILTNAINQTICLGQSSNLSASAAPIPYVQNCSPPAASNVFLPDGTGVSYTSPITVDCYSSGQLIQNASEIDDICLTIEHSYLGDLNISITCPNGQSAILKAYPGGLGAYLGCPLDDPAVGPGTSSVYCFNTSASTLLVNGAVAPCGVPSGNSIVAGDYLPVQPFTNLIGCPLNGQWVITITDNLALDNGYIFSWDINFNASLPGVQASFTPTVVSQGWITTTGLTPTGATAATVTPSSVGQNCYTYSATNNFGCTTTQVQCITVNAGVLPTFTQLGPYCQGSIPGVLPTTSTNGITGTWSAAISTAAAGSVVYTFTPTAGLCASPTTMNIVVSPQLIATISAPPILCPGATTTITVGASGGTGPYTGTGTYAVTAGTYTYTVTDINGCTSTVTITIAEPTPIVLPAITHN
jgi:PKD repeat protein